MAKTKENSIEYYKNFLLSNDLAYLSDKEDLLPRIELDWDYPAHISNSIIEFDYLDLSKFEKIIKQLDVVLCFYIELRITQEKVDFEKLIEISKIVQNSKITTFHLFLDSKSNSEELVGSNSIRRDEIIVQFPKLGNIAFFNSTKNDSYKHNDKYFIYTTSPLDNKFCGVITSNFFSINISTFTESQKYNTCLNRKVSINHKGEIKNCLSLINSYGNINEVDIKDVVFTNEFQKFWTINKSQIDVCKDCEFRNVCTDCRAFLENPNDLYSKPLKCGYDPYSGTWEEWSENPLKESAIKHYELNL